MARARRARPAGPGFFARLRRAVGLLLSREVAVLMNAIAFNVLLCLFPLLLVLVAAAQRLSPGSGTAQVLRLLLAELIPFGGETIAASLRQMTHLARGFEVLSLVLVVWGSSGVFMPVEMALEGKRRGNKVIGITSLDHSQSVSSRAPSGKRLFEVCDVTLDL